MNYKDLLNKIKSDKLELEEVKVSVKYINHDSQVGLIDMMLNSCIIKDKEIYHVDYVTKNMSLCLAILDNFTNIEDIDKLIESGKTDIIIELCDVMRYESELYDYVTGSLKNYNEVVELINVSIQHKIDKLNAIENVVAEKITEVMKMVKEADISKIEKLFTKIMKNVDVDTAKKIVSKTDLKSKN